MPLRFQPARGAAGIVLNSVVRGPVGPAGPPAARAFNFDSSTTDEDPGSGDFRLNSAIAASATEAYFDNSDSDGVSATTWLDMWDNAGDATTRGLIYLFDVEDPTVWQQYRVSGSVTDGIGYRKVSLTSLGGTGEFTAGNLIAVWFAPAGPTSSGSITGPVTSSDNAPVRWDGTTGIAIQNSTGWRFDDAGRLISPTNTATATRPTMVEQDALHNVYAGANPVDAHLAVNYQAIKSAAGTPFVWNQISSICYATGDVWGIPVWGIGIATETNGIDGKSWGFAGGAASWGSLDTQVIGAEFFCQAGNSAAQPLGDYTNCYTMALSAQGAVAGQYPSGFLRMVSVVVGANPQNGILIEDAHINPIKSSGYLMTTPRSAGLESTSTLSIAGGFNFLYSTFSDHFLQYGTGATALFKVSGAGRTSSAGVDINITGSASTPALRLTTDTNSGWYSPVANVWSLAISGTASYQFGNTGLIFGTVTIAAETFGENMQVLTEDTAPVPSTDYFVTYDDSADTGKKVKVETIATLTIAAPGYPTGRYISPYVASTTVALAANILYAVRFDSGKRTTWTRAAIEVTTTGTATAARLGLFTCGTDGLPGTLVTDFGTVAVGTMGVKDLTISQALEIGFYYLAVVADGSVTVRAANNAGGFNANIQLGQAVPGTADTQISKAFTYGVLSGATPFGTPTMAAASIPIVYLKVA